MACARSRFDAADTTPLPNPRFPMKTRLTDDPHRSGGPNACTWRSNEGACAWLKFW